MSNYVREKNLKERKSLAPPTVISNGLLQELSRISIPLISCIGLQLGGMMIAMVFFFSFETFIF